MNNQYSATEQPDPIGNDKVAIWEEVIKDFNESFNDTDVKTALLKDMTDRDAWAAANMACRFSLSTVETHS